MNGDAKEIYDRIGTLETQMEEKWKAQDQRSKDLLATINLQFENVKEIIKLQFVGLPCTERIKACDKRFLMMWAILIIILGVMAKGSWAG